MAKFFVTGASGMLGTTLYDVFRDAGHTVVSTDLEPLDPWTGLLDIRKKEDVVSYIREVAPDCVLNLAALTDVEYCEKHPQEAYDTNATGAENVAYACREFSIPMVHISTAGVFDGLKDSEYTEDDEPKPVNMYGKAKHAGDQAVADLLEEYYIFRAGWMMGGVDRDKKFIKKVLDQVDGGKDTLYALTDMFGCPTYTLDFARGILEMINIRPPHGLYHMVSEGHCSRYDVAKKMLEILELDHISLEEVTEGFFKKTFFAPRPPFEVIRNKKLHDLGLRPMRHWEDSLVDYLSTHFKEKYASTGRN